MGFGLHAGWAIEGAVGSLQKVDATYLSPHVNMSARLESASKQYGVAILMSQDIYDLMSDEGKEHCRRIDKVIYYVCIYICIHIYAYIYI
jgi:class 3 adenylate cyclase